MLRFRKRRMNVSAMQKQSNQSHSLRNELQSVFRKAKLPTNPAIAAEILSLVDDPNSSASPHPRVTDVARGTSDKFSLHFADGVRVDMEFRMSNPTHPSQGKPMGYRQGVWPENLESRRIWEETRRQTPCPGINEGPLVRIEDIRIQRDGNIR